MSDDREFLRESFWAYFNVADETYGDDGLTLEDLDRKMVEKARYVSQITTLPWPPYLPEAEEYALDHPELRS